MAENNKMNKDRLLANKLVDRWEERRLDADALAAVMVVALGGFIGVMISVQVGVGILTTNLIDTVTTAVMAETPITSQSLIYDLTSSYAIVALISAVIMLAATLFGFMMYKTLRGESKEDKRKLLEI